MGDLRIKAQELLKIKQNEQEYRYIEDNLAQEKSIEEEKIKSMKKFTEKIQYQIDNFQKNLLEASNRGEVLKIDILKLDSDNLVSWWDEREDNIKKSIYTEYSPIKSGIVTFIDDINLDFLTDDIILDNTLQKLYDTIRSNDIYPEWKVKENSNGKIELLYLEVNPLVSYKDKKDALNREKEIKQRALVIVDNKNPTKIEKKKNGVLKKISSFIFIFISVLYFSVSILIILSSAIGITNIENSNSFLEVAWPYFLITDFSNVGEAFIFSFPLGLLVSIYFAYKRS